MNLTAPSHVGSPSLKRQVSHRGLLAALRRRSGRSRRAHSDWRSRTMRRYWRVTTPTALIIESTMTDLGRPKP